LLTIRREQLALGAYYPTYILLQGSSFSQVAAMILRLQYGRFALMG
jgi:hypothetical protein